MNAGHLSYGTAENTFVFLKWLIFCLQKSFTFTQDWIGLITQIGLVQS